VLYVTPLAYVALLGWIPFVMVLFMLLPARKAAATALVGGWLIMPPMTLYFAGMPDYTKTTAATVGIVLGTLIFGLDDLQRFRLRWFDLPAFIYCFSGIVSSLQNGLGFYDGLSDALNQWLTWGLPYLIGRLYFGTLEDLRYFATAMVIGGLAYVLPCLFEIRMSPQIMNYIYGSFGGYQGIRLGGYRPYVFFRTGLELGLWMTAASMAGAWLWRCGAIKYLGSIPFGLILLPILLGTTIFCRSTGALLLLFTGLVVLWLSVRFRTRLFMVAIVLIAPLYVGVRVSKAWTGQQAVDLANLIEKERGESLAFRFDCENLLIERALIQPLFGWGGWNGSAVEVGGLDAHTGRPKTVTTDGLWIILLGTKGYFGLIGFYLVIAGPAMLFIRRFPPSQWGSPQVAAGSVAAMMLSLYTVDCLMNAFPNIIYMTLAGALAGLDPKQLRATGAGNVAGAARRTAGDSRRGAMAVPAAHGGPNMLADRYLRLGRSFRQEGSPDEADAAWRQALDMLTVLMEADPDVPGLRRQWCACANDLAWLRANHPDPGRRDPAGAVAMARRIVEECPDSQTYWNTLGVACYRAGDDASAVSALDRASALGGGTAFDDVFLALAHARLGELEAARLAFARASSHAERDHPGHPELAGFRDEARAILAEGTGSPAAAL
jgi:tetratricopeptide (TPR) repeat protein